MYVWGRMLKPVNVKRCQRQKGFFFYANGKGVTLHSYIILSLCETQIFIEARYI